MSKFTPFSLFIRQALLYPLTSPFLPPVNKVEKDYSYAAGQKIGTLEPAVQTGIPKTGQIVEYQDGDDGHYQWGYPKTGARFTDNGDNTITDNATGLMWIKDPSQISPVWGGGGIPNKMQWGNALTTVEDLNYAGHMDWRLPNVKELISIADYGRNSPAIDPLFTPTPYDAAYWTGTTLHYTTGVAWWVEFEDGKSWYADNGGKYVPCYVRPVRGG